ncbi:MAG: membrane protein insertase YidC, partial [Epibacterium sp.]|nr:membrane protein insertase YidC [Epibacterium sp.]NQX73690.1 membrane protein insertase YidC [Epibacterium sp.]
MDDQNRNLILATVLSGVVLLGWSYFFPAPEPVEVAEAVANETGLNAPATAPQALAAQSTPTPQSETTSAPRLAIETPRVEGSISLRGGRIDDLRLKDYRETLDEGSPIVTMLRPADEADAYYTLYGWAPGVGLGLDDVPGANTLWSAPADATLTPETPVTLRWDNGKGLTFTRTVSIDENYMFSVTQGVQNGSGATVELAPYGTIARHGEPSDLMN